MDKYIILSFQNDFLIFSQTGRLPSPEDVINSNNIYHNKFIYTFKYFKRNTNDILVIINKHIVLKNINKVCTEDHRLVDDILKFIKLLKIEYFYSKNFKSLTETQCDLIINNKKLLYINAYYIPSEYHAKMIKQKKRVNINYIDSISEGFMFAQNSADSDALYFKKEIYIEEHYDYKERDIREFLKLNIYLKTIHAKTYNKKILDSIISCLMKDVRENVLIVLHKNDNKFIENNLNYLKSLKQLYRKGLKGNIKIVNKNFNLIK